MTTPAKKAARKTAAKKAAKTTARKTAVRKTAAKKAAKTTARKTAVRKTAAKKAAKTTARKTAVRKTAAKKAAKKTAAKKAVRKTAAKKAAKTTARKTAFARLLPRRPRRRPRARPRRRRPFVRRPPRRLPPSARAESTSVRPVCGWSLIESPVHRSTSLHCARSWRSPAISRLRSSSAAEQAAHNVELPDEDATDIPFVTVDPAGSRDLDQAVHIAAQSDGYLVSYAIADVAAFVRPDSARRRRGASPWRDALLPGSSRPAAPAGAQRGCSEPVARPAPSGRAVAHRARRRRRGPQRRRAPRARSEPRATRLRRRAARSRTRHVA